MSTAIARQQIANSSLYIPTADDNPFIFKSRFPEGSFYIICGSVLVFLVVIYVILHHIQSYLCSRLASVSSIQENNIYKLTASTESLIFDYYLDAIDLLSNNNKTNSCLETGSPKTAFGQIDNSNHQINTSSNANRLSSEIDFEKHNVVIAERPEYSIEKKSLKTPLLQESVSSQESHDGVANLGIIRVRSSLYNLNAECKPSIEGLILTGGISNIIISGDNHDNQGLSNFSKSQLSESTWKEIQKSNSIHNNDLEQKPALHSAMPIKYIKPVDLLNEVLNHRAY